MTWTVGFRLLTMGDLPDVVRWQQAEHVAKWFDGPTDVAQAEARYGDRLRGAHPTRMYAIQLRLVADGRPVWRDVGYIQAYRLGQVPWVVSGVASADTVGIDYLIGEADVVGRGVGSAMLEAFIGQVIPVDFPDAPAVVAAPNHRNRASRALLLKAGFVEGLWVDEPRRDATVNTVVVYTRRLTGAG